MQKCSLLDAHVQNQATVHTCVCAHLQVENIGIDEESLAFLGEVGDRTSLRHGVQLLTPSMMLARTNG